jgi:NAD(P)-dependent dehydrogenase (short-subunit alcohol dehydrogenase family)
MEGFKNKVAVVTGGSSGLGQTVAKRFYEEGANTIILDIKVNEDSEIIREIGKKENKIVSIKCDVSDEKDVKDSFNKITKLFGKVDILHANAAIAFKYCPLTELTVKDWNKIINVNLTGVFLSTKYAIIKMLQNKGGKIIITGSNWAFVSDPGYSSYVASKGGVVSFGRAIAQEYAKNNINVNIICPGNMYTPQLLESGEFEKKDFNSVVEKIGQISTTDEVADAVLFLASYKAKAIKGSVIIIDQGETLQYGPGLKVENNFKE